MSAGTVKGYKSSCGTFIRFLETDGRDYADALSGREAEQAIRSYIRWLRTVVPGKDGRLDTSTIARHLAALSTYFAWEVLEGRRRRNPVRDAPVRLKQDPDARALINGRQLFKLYLAAERVMWPWNPEFARCALALLSGLGLRVSEARTLTEFDVDLYKNTVHVRTPKNDVPIIKPIGRSFVPFFEDWRDKREEMLRRRELGRASTQKWLFLTAHWELGEEGLYTLLRQLIKISRQDLPGVYPHALRHFAITQWNKRGGLKEAQVLAGHKDVKTTAGYVHPDSDYLRYVVDAPGAAIFRPKEQIRRAQLELDLLDPEPDPFDEEEDLYALLKRGK